MISPEHIHDALTLLPDDLIQPVDALRRKKPVPWKTLTALAACLCLAAGLWFFFPGGAFTAAESADDGSVGIAGNTAQDPGAAGYILATVTEVGEDHIRVLQDGSSTLITVNLAQLEEIPDLAAGKTVRIYYEERETPGELTPYRIEIAENQKEVLK